MTAGNQRTTIVGVFHDRAKAQEAINALKRAGFQDNQIGVTSPGADGKGHLTTEGGESYAPEGAAAGLATGAGIGALWGLAVVSGVLPAIGPAIAGGTLAAILSSAAAGAAAAGLTGALVGMGFSKDEAEFYEGEFKAGRTIVTVQCQTRSAEAQRILQSFGGYERSTASSAMASSSASRSTTTASAASAGGECRTGMTGKTAALGATGQTVQAREEQLHVNKQREQVGEVNIRKEVHTEHKTIEVPVEREEVVIERRAVAGRTASGPIQEGQTIRVPVSEEHVEVTKTPVVKEEVSVGKRKVKGTERVSADVRKEEIKIEREGDARVKDKR